jgi:hypothetical protein
MENTFYLDNENTLYLDVENAFYLRAHVGGRRVVNSGAFFYFLLHNHIINIKKKSFSGEVKENVNFPFFLLLHKRAKSILPTCPLPPSLRPPIHPECMHVFPVCRFSLANAWALQRSPLPSVSLQDCVCVGVEIFA